MPRQNLKDDPKSNRKIFSKLRLCVISWWNCAGPS